MLCNLYPCQNTVSMGRVVIAYVCGPDWKEHDTQLILIRRLVVLLTSPVYTCSSSSVVCRQTCITGV